MKKKNIMFTCCFVLGLIVFSYNYTYSFCVYNFTDTNIGVDQVKGGKMVKDFFASLKPGEKACCNWKNRDCNKQGKRDSILKFDVYYGDYKFICQDFSIKAGGWLLIKGKDKNYACEAGYK